jgi:D-alanyl-D-alanine carboxypeptidase
VGSVTKMFAGAVVLELVARAGLSLDAPARDHLPADVVAHLANAREASISQLLHHTSGVYDYLGSSELLFAAYGSYEYEYQAKEDLLAYAYGHDAEFPVGTGWDYSSSNYILLEMIAEDLGGRSGVELLGSLIIDRLGLRSTHYDPGRPPPAGLARGYGDLFGDGRLLDVTDLELERFHYDGGVVSNVYDLADFLDALLAGDLLAEGSRAALLDVVATHGHSERGTDFYGSGIILEQHPTFGPVYGHSGTTLGFSAHVYRLERSGITFAAIVNASQHGLEERSYRWFSPLEHDDILALVSGPP